MTDSKHVPWYRRTYRWGQTNLTEVDPIRYDAEWWREHWRRTRLQGIVVNAGGIVAYYPSKLTLQHQAEFLGERDLYGEIVAMAHEDGLAVLARMDCNRTDERFYVEHPDWFVVDAEGKPYREGDLYVSCISGPYYDEFIPAVITEVIERSHPEGLTDNSWSGPDRSHICYCQNCARKFRQATGMSLPKSKDWNNPAYRQWIVWSYARRMEVWDLFNKITKEVGGPDCLYLGMNAGDPIHQSIRFRDFKSICERSEMLMLDFQARTVVRPFYINGEAGKLIHGLMGWDKLIPESTAMYQYQFTSPFRLGSKPAAEARMWAVEAFAGGMQPWWHHIGAYHEDRRQYKTAEPIFKWHEANEEYLVDRKPVANVGVVWTQTNVDFYGRDAAMEKVGLPSSGFSQALIRGRIPYLPVHADHVDRDAEHLAVLILPNVGALNDQQVESIRRFVQNGGGLVATGESSLYDEWGDRRPDFALADLFGAHATGTHHGSSGASDKAWDAWATHTYLRLTPELRAGVYGPKTGAEPPAIGERHPVLAGFDEADSLPFGGRLEVVHPAPGAQVLATFIPPFPIYPPETSWMRQPTSSLPAIILNEVAGGGRVVYVPADLDRCFGRDNALDHARALANAVRWAAKGELPLGVEGPGTVDCHLFTQKGRLVLHLVNLTFAGSVKPPIDELIPTGPYRARVRLRDGVAGRSARLLVAGSPVEVKVEGQWANVVVPSISDHEVVVIE